MFIWNKHDPGFIYGYKKLKHGKQARIWLRCQEYANTQRWRIPESFPRTITDNAFREVFLSESTKCTDSEQTQTIITPNG